MHAAAGSGMLGHPGGARSAGGGRAMAGSEGVAAVAQRRPTAADVLNNAGLLRRLLDPVRRVAPILAVGQRVLVTRHDDVREVLRRDEDFTVGDTNGPRLDRMNGPFLLGMDRSPLYLRDKSILQQAVYPDDLDDLRVSVRTAARSAVEAAGGSGTIDVVTDLARPITYCLVSTYFGLPGPGEATTLGWMQDIFRAVFVESGNPTVRRSGERAAAQLHAHADDVIARTKLDLASAATRVPDTVVARLVRLQSDPASSLSDEGVRRNVSGLMVAAVETMKAVAHVVDELLRRPATLADATEAARADDVESVAAFAFEALRFRPLNPILPRRVARPTLVAEGTSRQRYLPAGHTVLAGLLPAMFDPAAVEHPGEFRTDRPVEVYLLFGHGLHSCFGERINRVQIPEMVTALLAAPGLRRASGPEGQLSYKNSFADRLVVELGTSRPSASLQGVGA